MGNTAGGGRQKKIKRGGVLTHDDIAQITNLIDHRMQLFNLIPTSATPSPLASGNNTAHLHNGEIIEPIKNVPSAVFATAALPLKKDQSSSTNVYFHMIKLTAENLSEWKAFETSIKKMANLDSLINYDTFSYSIIDLTAGLNYFSIQIDSRYDKYVVYVSKELNNTNNPPDWRDVECMVTVIAKDDIPYFTNMGILALPHTFTKKNFIRYLHEDGSNRGSLKPELFNYLTEIDFNYPSHKYVSLYLFIFIGAKINSFYSTLKTALLTSPTAAIAHIVSKELNNKRLEYGYESNRPRRVPNRSISLTLFNNTTHDTLVLTRDMLKQLCPWYCNIFYTELASRPNDENNCYDGPDSYEPFVYVPITSFEELLIQYHFDDIL